MSFSVWVICEREVFLLLTKGPLDLSEQVKEGPGTKPVSFYDSVISPVSTKNISHRKKLFRYFIRKTKQTFLVDSFRLTSGKSFASTFVDISMPLLVEPYLTNEANTFAAEQLTEGRSVFIESCR
jgi:hypothetical protein